jgi:integrase
MIRTLSDSALRLGEMLALARGDFDGQMLHSRGTAHNGKFYAGDSPTKKHVRDVPAPPSLATAIQAIPPRIDSQLLYPTPSGTMWIERNFYRDVWHPTVQASGMQAVPHDFRHSCLTHLGASDIDDADLAQFAGHGVSTLNEVYRHPLNRSFERIRQVIG